MKTSRLAGPAKGLDWNIAQHPGLRQPSKSSGAFPSNDCAVRIKAAKEIGSELRIGPLFQGHA